MGRLPRASPRIGGVPVNLDTLKGLTGAAIDKVLGRSVPSEVAVERMQTCQGCEMFDGRRWAACGCFMQQKVGLPSASCPLHKWKR